MQCYKIELLTDFFFLSWRDECVYFAAPHRLAVSTVKKSLNHEIELRYYPIKNFKKISFELINEKNDLHENKKNI